MSKLFTVSFAAAAAATTLPMADAEAATSTVKDRRVAGIALSTLSKDAPSQVKLYDASGRFHAALTPFGGFTGGVFVGGGDVNGDGRADIVTGQADGSVAKAFDGRGFKDHLTVEPFGAQFQGGVRVAVGDVDGDGRADIITGAGPGATEGPHVRVFTGNGDTLQKIDAFPRFLGGVTVATGDVNGDGVADIIVGAGPGGGPHVRSFDGTTGALIGLLLPYGENYDGGVELAFGRFRGENALFASKIAAGDGSVRVVRMSDLVGIDFRPFGEDYVGGVSLGFTFAKGVDTLVVGQAKGNTVGFLDVSRIATVAGPQSDAVSMPGGLFFKPFGDSYSGGISVAGLGPTAPVPEPTSWALMISGFALAGAASRRRLRAQRASVSAG